MSPIIAFAGNHRIAAGDPADVAIEAKRWLDRGENRPMLAFDLQSSRRVELDLRGDEAGIRARLATQPVAAQPAGHAREPAPRGRPKLGVTAREVTLLPRQWEWLSKQPGGASATLRRLVSQAQRGSPDAEARRQAQESLYRFVTVMAGDAPGYEEAIRALFADDEPGFRQWTTPWPEDVRAHALDLAGKVFGTAVAG